MSIKVFRITLEVDDLDGAASFYAKLLETPGKRHPGARHYFDCGGVIIAIPRSNPGAGLKPTPIPGSLSTSPSTTSRPRTRPRQSCSEALSPFAVHGQPAADVITLAPGGEKSFYVTDRWGNELCFVQEGTLYT